MDEKQIHNKESHEEIACQSQRDRQTGYIQGTKVRITLDFSTTVETGS